MEALIKTYAGYMKEITPDELYEGLLGYGLFAETLPTIFSSEAFMEYMKKMYPRIVKYEYINENGKQKEDPLYTEWVSVDVMRDNTVPRTLGIPNPFTYHNLCFKLKEKWPKLQQIFAENTKNWRENKVSRVHIRKRKDSRSLFKMTYNDWHSDKDVDQEWLIGSKYIVKTDISSCFPSIYTHVLPWAIIGKEEAKKEVGKPRQQWSAIYKFWNELDTFTRYIKNNETNGLLIGPHASNVLSEIILTKIDAELSPEWHYERAIDDYTCYISKYEESEIFINDLVQQLRKYNLSLNYKKTKIEKLPEGNLADRHEKLKSASFLIFPNKEYEEGSTRKYKQRYLNYEQVKMYLDKAVELACTGEVNASTINYAIKVLGNTEDFKLSKNAKAYFYTTSLYLAGIYPYLLRLLDEYVLGVFPEEKKYKTVLVQNALQHAKSSNQFEEAYYAIYFDMKYQLNAVSMEKLKEHCEWIRKSDDCLLKLFGWLWCRYYQQTKLIESFRQEAKNLATNNGWGRNWLFTYECLDENELSELSQLTDKPYKLADKWYELKKSKISFLKEEFQDLVRRYETSKPTVK